MREYKYRSLPIPEHLNSENIKREFNKNIEKGYYDSGSIYNDSKKNVKNTLKKIYHDKCAFCEATLKNSYGEIEHYRPKKSSNLSRCDSTKAYYWLAFSWDNLLPSCKMCNLSKSNCFDINDTRVDYEEIETLNTLHKSLAKYNEKENPKLLHPEIDKFENKIFFENKGKIVTKDERVKYTVEVCNLNRKGLSELREIIITNYRNKIKKMFKILIFILVIGEIKNMLKIMRIIFDEIFENSKIEKEFSAVSLYICNNFDYFINNTSFEEKDKEILTKLWKKYKTDIMIN